MDPLSDFRLVPVLASNDPDDASWLADQMVQAGLPIVEVTFRSDRALEVLSAMASNPDLLVGAGTVVSAAQVEAARTAGAQFVVSPGLSEDVVRACQEYGLPVLPGVATASETMSAIDMGLRTLKFFPAERLGGPATLGAFAPVFPEVRFIPSGGITPTNAREYLDTDCVAAVGGSWMFDKTCIQERDSDRMIATLTEALEVTKDIRS